MKFVGVIERETTITVDGYSNKKTELGAIREMGRYISNKLGYTVEGEGLVKGGKECLLAAKYSCGGYFLEVEEVPCACQWHEDTEEMEYADGRWYVVCRFVK